MGAVQVREQGRARDLQQGPASLPAPAGRGATGGHQGQVHGRVHRSARREKAVTRAWTTTPAERIKDMDFEGVDVNLTLPSGWFGTWTAGDDVALEMGMYRAYHRWMEDYCGAYPDAPGRRDPRLRARRPRQPRGDPALGQVALGVGRHGLRAVRHAARSSRSRADVGGGARSTTCAVALHTFTVMPPYAPGGLDTWDNLFLQRSAAHPWCGMRNMAALIGSGRDGPLSEAAHRHAGGRATAGCRSGWRAWTSTRRRSRRRCRS